MATKKLETEFINLKKEFKGLQTLIQNLLDKHGDLERKHKKFLQKRNKIKCRNCGDRLQSLRELKNHKKEGCSSSEFNRDECEECYKDENKLQDYTEKMHVKYDWDNCHTVFK